MSKKCGICGKSINKNQEVEPFLYKGTQEQVHSICAKGRRKAKKTVGHSNGHCTPGGGFQGASKR